MHRYICSESGGGKSNLIVYELLEIAEEERRWIKLIAPHPQVGELFVSELYDRWGDDILNRVIVERLADMDRVLMRRYIFSSQATDHFVRLNENDEFAQAVVEMLCRRRGLADLAEHPVLEKHTKLAVRLFQNQSKWASESWLPFALRPGHPVWGYLIANCTDPETAWEFMEMQRFSQKDRLYMLEPAERLLAGVFRSPPIMARTTKPDRFDWVSFLNDGGIYVLLGGNVSDDALRVHAGCDFAMTAFSAKRRLLIDGVYVIDEAANYNLLGSFEAKMFNTLRAFKLEDDD